MSNFAEDIKRWEDQSFRPHDASPLPMKVGRLQTVRLLWHHAAIWATLIYRLSNWCSRHRIRGLPILLERINLHLFGIEIGSSVPIGPGLYIPHPSGTVIMASRIGANCSFIHAVTIGMRETWEFPVIGDAVMVGAGARVLGGIRLGEGCRIGANAVVLDSVPDRVSAVGVPARVVRSKKPKVITAVSD
jgi:serine O-acetyltransferase